MKSLVAAKTILINEAWNLVLIDDETVYKSKEHGIRALLKLVTDGEDYHGAVAADRIVGKASAMLYSLLGVEAVFAAVLSEPGKAILEAHGIRYEYEILTKNIINRAGTGLCPMEDAVKDIDDANLAVAALRKRVAEMMSNQH